MIFPPQSSALGVIGNSAGASGSTTDVRRVGDSNGRSCFALYDDYLDAPPSVFALYIENPATGYVQVQTFSSRFDRALRIIVLSEQPLILRTADY